MPLPRSRAPQDDRLSALSRQSFHHLASLAGSALARRKSPFARLKLALVTDELTRECLSRECRVRDVTPDNYRHVLERWKPDILFVESTWKGVRDAWRYKVAAYPDHPERSNDALAALVAAAREADIPAVFWNREDGVHFERFIDSASLFDHVLTVDETMLPRYRERLGAEARLGVMMFAASPSLHFPADVPVARRAAFVGSYGRHVHDARRGWQDAMFAAARPLGLTIFDRNSDRKPDHYRFPEHPWIEVRPAIPHHHTPRVYRRHMVNLNVNTITDSATAFSRRLVEVLACGGLVLTNRTKAVDTHFGDLCHVSDDGEEAAAIFERLAASGEEPREMEMRRAAADRVRTLHSWSRRLEELLDFAGG